MGEHASAALTVSKIIPSIDSYRDFHDFLAKHTLQRTSSDGSIEKTNTRIGDAAGGIYGGTYHISDAEYPTFMTLYNRDIVQQNKKEYLTEKQRTDDGPIVVDLDFRHNLEVDERQYTSEHIEDLVDAYADEIGKIYQYDSEKSYNIFVLEKPTVNRVSEKNCTKDGIHIIIGLQADHATQQILRKRMINRVKEMWADLPITNSWNDVFDEGISKGTTNWQLYGSRKPNHERYRLTRVIEISVDPTDGEIMNKTIPLSKFDIDANIQRLSIRYKYHPTLFFKNEFVAVYNAFKSDSSGPAHNTSTHLNTTMVRQHRIEMTEDVSTIAAIRNKDELDMMLTNFLESVQETPSDYELKCAHDYVMILPVSYYGEGSYDKWIRVGWVLRNMSKRLLIVWIAFSAKSPTFQYSGIPDLCEKWRGFDVKLQGGLTKLSLIHWAKTDAREHYEKVHRNTVDYYIEQTITSGNGRDRVPDFDLARVLYQFYKHEYVCVSVSQNIWYRYKNNRWAEIDAGTSLRKCISETMRDMYNNKTVGFMQTMSSADSIFSKNHRGGSTNSSSESLPERKDASEQNEEMRKARSVRVLNISQRLASTSDKKNIMTEAKELFYDGTFLQKLDNNPYLLCFTNGVIDFKQKVFRRGQPEDNISMTTRIEYIPFNPAIHQKTKDEIQDFMNKLFPEPELCKYMWEHLASTLIGTATNQTFNMYIGIGQNGKSVLVNLMEKVLGDYKGDVPLTLVTDKRTKTGGVCPEIVQLKGVRYAVMQEPSKGDVINEGIMKQLTSGKDPIQGRAPYMKQILSFLPQFKLVVTCNTLMNVNSNDHGTWRRIRAVPFKSLFTDKPVQDDKEKPYQFKLDKYIDEKFDSWKEVFAAMLVEIAFKTNGNVTDCNIVLAKSNEYRQSQDYISEFVRDRIVREAGGRIKKMELNNEFSIWYMSNYGGRGPSPKDLHEFMDKEYGRQRNQIWSGVRIRYERDNEEEGAAAGEEDNNGNDYDEDISAEEL